MGPAETGRLRRMVAEPNSDNGYTDAVLSETVSRYPVADAAGETPTVADGSVNSVWAPSYDLNAAAAEIWQEKAASLAAAFDFSADGASYQRSQAVTQAQQMASFYRSRRYGRSLRVHSTVSSAES